MVKCKAHSTPRIPPTDTASRYRKYKGWVKCILIRRVDDIAAIGIEEKNQPARFEKAFKDIPNDIWHVFDDPTECVQIINDAVARG
jgi:hypothetical protein